MAKMCPDRELLSAWVDGEISSPWRESLERHLEACPSCSAYTAELRSLHAAFATDSASIEAPASRARTRVYDGVILGASSRAPVWTRRLSIPVPFAAAAALAFSVLALALAMTGARNSELRMAVQSVVAPVSVASSGPAMDSIFEFLARQEGGVNITISLPSGTFAGAPGEPFIVREVDYKPGSGQ
jgi:anti-sigma factor RsiW